MRQRHPGSEWSSVPLRSASYAVHEGEERALFVVLAAGQLSRFVDSLVAAFLEERAGRGWAKRTVPALKRWMQAA